MRLHILSDSHLEFGPLDLPLVDADVVVLAGDINVGMNGLAWMRRHFPEKPVVYVLGNHEFYHQSLPDLTEQLRREAGGSNIHVLENEAVEIGGYTFLGATLWTDFGLHGNAQLSMQAAADLVNDYRLIRYSPEARRLSPKDTRRLHLHSAYWLQQELPRHDRSRSIIVTHHAPSRLSEQACYAQSALSPSFVSDLDGFVKKSGVPLWIHGHTHHCVDYMLGSTRVISNQRGYSREYRAGHCPGFNPGLIIEL